VLFYDKKAQDGINMEIRKIMDFRSTFFLVEDSQS